MARSFSHTIDTTIKQEGVGSHHLYYLDDAPSPNAACEVIVWFYQNFVSAWDLSAYNQLLCYVRSFWRADALAIPTYQERFDLDISLWLLNTIWWPGDPAPVQPHKYQTISSVDTDAGGGAPGFVPVLFTFSSMTSGGIGTFDWADIQTLAIKCEAGVSVNSPTQAEYDVWLDDIRGIE